MLRIILLLGSFYLAATSLVGSQDVLTYHNDYYTTDGSTPDTSSKVYTAPIPFNSNLTIKAFATASGY